MLISPEYLELQRQLHAEGNYGTAAAKWAKTVAQQAEQIDAKTLLDYGCGPGLLKKGISGAFDPRYEVFEYDPAIAGKDTPPAPADMVFCGDVLEHVEPVFLDAVLNDLRRLTKTLVMLVISTWPAQKYLADGRNAHLIIQPPHWWMRKCEDRWSVISFSGGRKNLQYIGIPK